MGLPEPDDPSLLDRVYLFLKSRLGCWAALACLFGGLLCAWGIDRAKLWAIVAGGVLMAPYALAAIIFVLVTGAMILVILCLIAVDNWLEWLRRKKAR